MHVLRVLFILVLAGGCSLPAAGKHWDDLRKQVESTLHVSLPLPALEQKSYGKFGPAPGISAERVSYATAYALRVPAIVYRDASPTITRHPAFVIVDGHGGDKSVWYSYWAGILYARFGVVVLTYDPIGEFERNRERLSRTGQHDQIQQPDDMARRLSGLMLTDIRQAVAYLQTRKDVDSKRIAVLGFSMGSFLSALECATDKRVNACVLAGGGDLDEPGGYWDKSKPMCQGIPYQSLKILGERGPILYALNAKRGPTLVINGTADRVVDIPGHNRPWFDDLRRKTIQQAGSSKNVFDLAFVEGGGHRPYFLTRQAALWLSAKLKFDKSIRKEIETMPETRVADWNRKYNSPIPVSPTFELNEGGTEALGNDIPAVPRDQLHAIPESVWSFDLRNYVYETWVERARAAIRSGAP